MQYKHKVVELETIIADITKENQRLSGLYYEKNVETENLKRRVGGTDFSSSEEYERLQKENGELKKALTV